MIVRRVTRWFDARLGASSFAHKGLKKVFPDHWSFVLGEIAMFAFVILVLTGIFLTMFFEASPEEVTYEGSYEPLHGQEVSRAYRSVLDLSFEVRAGLFIRQIHHWAALIFVAVIVLHLTRVFFTGAFRKPREINWVIGLMLLALALVNGFTGYTLPDDLLSGTGVRITHSIILSIPIVGTWIAFLIFGGEFGGGEMIQRFFVIHILIIPVLIGAFMTLHLAILWRQKHSQFPGPGRTETNVVGKPLWPHHMIRMAALFFALFALLSLLGGLVQINPIWIYGPFHPTAVPVPAQPDWYLGWVEGALRLFPPLEVRAFGYTLPTVFFPAVLMPGVTFALLVAWPWMEARLIGDRAYHHMLDRPRDHPVRAGLGSATLTFYGLLLLAGSNDITADLLDLPVLGVTRFYQVAVLTLPWVVGFFVYRSLKARRDRSPAGDTGGEEPISGGIPEREIRRRREAERRKDRGG